MRFKPYLFSPGPPSSKHGALEGIIVGYDGAKDYNGVIGCDGLIEYFEADDQGIRVCD
jgi:hypothetical protein